MSSTDGDYAEASCEACERDDALSSHEKPAGLEQIDYRIGTHGRFASRMRGWISRQVVPPNDATSSLRPLAALTTRATDDPALALIDTWACVLDVLTFYQERIANEGFLRTATERQSVQLLADAIGYQLAPGLAASTWLAFTLLDTEKAPREVELPSGLQVQSVPGPGDRPQTFETAEAILARPEWNAMRPVQREPSLVRAGIREVFLAGLSTRLPVGDKLLVIGDERLGRNGDVESDVWELRTVVTTALDKDQKMTRVLLERGFGWLSGDVYTVPLPARPRLFAFSRRAHVFGHSAPDPRMFSARMKRELADMLVDAQDDWKNFTVTEPPNTELVLRIDGSIQPIVHLVGEEKEILPGSLIVFQSTEFLAVYEVVVAQISSRADFGLTLTTTRLTLDTTHLLDKFEPRSVIVHCVSRELAPGTRPILDSLSGKELVIDQEVTPLEPGRTILVKGAPYGSAEDAEDQAELAVVSQATPEERYGALRTVLRLEARLAQSFDRTRSVVLGNLARATHGKTVANEVLGSGNGSKPFQTFTLRQQPVTHVASPSGGIESSLTVRVGGVAWTPEASPFGLGPDAEAYVARIDDAGKTTLSFGDGKNGTRLPTGRENVTASYRVGLGAEGLIDKDKLTVLKTRPQGVKSVTNPLASVGAEDPETLADARQNAPLTVLTLDRMVSLRDYGDFAGAYPGIGKAQAVRLWDGRRFWVHLTLATLQGAPLLASEALYQSLTSAIDAQRDPVQRVLVDTFDARSFKLRGTLHVDPAFVAADVIASVRAALVDEFSFTRRAFGQAVTGSEILRLVHRVPGVVAIDLNALWPAGAAEPDPSALSPASWRLPALGAAYGASGIQRAELLLLDEAEDAVDIEVATS
jgi:hypothetical protein